MKSSLGDEVGRTGRPFLIAAAVATATLALTACPSSSGAVHSTPTPTVTTSPSPAPSPLTLAVFIRRVQSVLDRSAAVRPRASAAIDQATTLERTALSEAHTTFIRILFMHQVQQADLANWNPPPQAREAATLLDQALSALIDDERAYITWIMRLGLNRPKGEVKHSLEVAQAADAAVVRAEAAFLDRYNPLRTAAGLQPLPTGYQF